MFALGDGASQRAALRPYLLLLLLRRRRRRHPPLQAELAEYAPASELVLSPSAEAMAAAQRVLAMAADLPGATDGGLWSQKRTESVDAQHVIAAALATTTQYHVSRYAVRSAAQMKPCKRLVVSVATIPSRIERLYNLVSTLRRQNLPPDQVLIAVPPFAPRLRQAYEIPAYLRDDPFVKIVSLPADFGPLSKLAAALYSERDPETCIVTIDDDAEAREFLLQIMATWGAIYPDAVVSAQGWNVTCIIGRVPYVCPGHHGEPYLFVRQVRAGARRGERACYPRAQSFAPTSLSLSLSLSLPPLRDDRYTTTCASTRRSPSTTSTTAFPL